VQFLSGFSSVLVLHITGVCAVLMQLQYRASIVLMRFSAVLKQLLPRVGVVIVQFRAVASGFGAV
jgi:hypothetical protein